MSTLQFGLGVPASAAPGRDPVALARRAEDLGFDFISTSDHPAGDEPSYEAWTMLSWIAAATSRITVASRVLGVPYRHPAMVAKMAETLDRLSGGRLILGLGGGYSDAEFRAFGLGVPSPREKIDGLAEAVAIIRGLWSGPAFSFAGTRYRTEAADLEPKPARHIPVWLGTFGPRALAVTGRLADGWIPSLGYMPVEEIPAMRRRIDAAAEAAGRHPRDIRGILNLGIRIDPGASPQPDLVTGPVHQVLSQLHGLLDLGFTGFSFLPVGPDRKASMQHIAEEVIPALRSARS